jgi:hypothetical protein
MSYSSAFSGMVFRSRRPYSVVEQSFMRRFGAFDVSIRDEGDGDDAGPCEVEIYATRQVVDGRVVFELCAWMTQWLDASDVVRVYQASSSDAAGDSPFFYVVQSTGVATVTVAALFEAAAGVALEPQSIEHGGDDSGYADDDDSDYADDDDSGYADDDDDDSDGKRADREEEAPLVLEPVAYTSPAASGLAWPAPWMQAHGEDEFGCWAAVSIAGEEHKFRWCPPGKSLMGSPKTEAGRSSDEGPQHEVELTQGFWIGEAPVTQRQWEAVAGSNPSDFKGLDLPVEQVSWDDAQAWMSQANARIGALGLRFPTEAEWEYATRAGTTGATYRGGNDAATLDDIAWYGENSGRTTHPVKLKAPNPWGLYDTLGNVWEWCADSRRTYTSARAVIRGGSWYYGARYVRAAYRLAYPPDFRNGSLGFRLARGQ